MKKIVIVLFLVAGFAGWSCSRFEDRKDLKQSLQANAEKINDAVSKISSTDGFKLISVNDAVTKSMECQNLVDTITLDMVAGIYTWQPDRYRYHHPYFPVSLFKKTGESEHMIVNMPERLMFRPKYLLNYCTCDSVKKNNFTIDASDYHLYFNGWNKCDYKLAAGFLLDAVSIGSCEITNVSDSENGTSYTSKYTFTEGLSITTERSFNDTMKFSFALKDKDEVLLSEKVTSIWTKLRKIEREYILSIGNVDIVRSTGIDSIQVYVSGVLQKKAAVKVIDEASGDGEHSICQSRDLEITFDDGTTTKLSTLIGPARETLKTLIPSLGNMYFAKHIVDYIAVSIFFNTHH